MRPLGYAVGKPPHPIVVMRVLRRHNHALGRPDADRVSAAVATYVRTIVQDEWPRLRASGEERTRAAAALDCPGVPATGLP